MVSGGTAVVLVSHNMDQVLELTTRVLWLDGGHVRAIGAPHVVVDAYLANQGAQPDRRWSDAEGPVTHPDVAQDGDTAAMRGAIQ